MTEQLDLLARASDPATSHRAAASVQRETVREVVAEIIYDYGEVTDADLIRIIQHSHPAWGDSTIRTRRSELVKDKRVRDSGRRSKSESGRDMIVWEWVG